MNCTQKTKRFHEKKRPSHYASLCIMMAIIITASFAFSRTGECGLREQRCSGPVAKKGYKFTVMAEGLPRVDNITKAGNGVIYVTLERSRGRGKVVRLTPDGKMAVILSRLNEPDGIRAANGKLYIVEESKKGRVLEYDIKKKTLRVIKKIGYIEGLIVTRKNELLLTKDRKKGKLIRLSLDGKVKVLKKGLKRPEGIVLGKNGEVFIAETSTGRILSYRGGKIKTVLTGLNNPDQLAMTSDGALLITEDDNPGRFLLYDKGRLHTIATCLSSPQGILPVEDGILVSEQGWGRILKFSRR